MLPLMPDPPQVNSYMIGQFTESDTEKRIDFIKVEQVSTKGTRVKDFLGVFPYLLKGSKGRGCCILYIVQIVM